MHVPDPSDVSLFPLRPEYRYSVSKEQSVGGPPPETTNGTRDRQQLTNDVGPASNRMLLGARSPEPFALRGWRDRVVLLAPQTQIDSGAQEEELAGCPLEM